MLDILEKAALEAGKAILDVYNAGPNVSFKDDQSPVTEADPGGGDVGGRRPRVHAHADAATELPLRAEAGEGASSDRPMNFRNDTRSLIASSRSASDRP